MVVTQIIENAQLTASVASVAADSLFSVLSAKWYGAPIIHTSAHPPPGADSYGADSHASAELTSADMLMLLLTLSVAMRVANFHYTKLPAPVAVAFGAIILTIVLLVLSHIPWLGLDAAIEGFRGLLKEFPEILLNYMLGFLLFAAAVEVNIVEIGRVKTTVLALALGSTLLSTVMVGVLTYFLMQNIAPMDLSWCLLFGSIVSPTDPVTVNSILKEKKDLIPSSTRYFIVCESLLNDAVGVVLYLVLLEIVQKPDIRAVEIASLLLGTVFKECVYGILIGVFLAWLAYSAVHSIDDDLLEVAITLVLVGNINVVCRLFHASIPLASVGAGLYIGSYGTKFAMRDETIKMFHRMWELADETLNAILFLMIGAADLFWNPQDLGLSRCLILVVCTISISLVARLFAVAIPLFTIICLEKVLGRRLRHETVKYRGGTVAILTWAGMRGGISIALALGVPDSFVRHAVPGHMTYGQIIFFMTFILVVFSIVVQGLLFEPVVKIITNLSYKFMPSGGLSTYKSSNSIGRGMSEFEGYIHDVSDDDVFDTDNMWDASAVLDRDYGNVDENTPLVPQQSGPRRGDFHRHVSDVGPRDGHSMMGNFHYPSALPPHIIQMEGAHERQPSLTFTNLPALREPPTIPSFLGNLRRHGTTSFQYWFNPGQVNDTTDPTTSGALRRSRTEPEIRREQPLIEN